MEATILLVEDSELDAKIIKRALADSRINGRIVHFEEGVEALDYLNQCKPQAGSGQYKLPDIILIDLNLPGMSGYELLQQIKTTKNLKLIPVIIMSSSADENEITACYQSGANCYVTKPMMPKEYARIIHTITDFWLNEVTLPTKALA